MTKQSLKDEYEHLVLQSGARKVTSTDDALILKLVQLLLGFGAEHRASDLHIEPTIKGARIRYRIDGILHELLQVPAELRDPLVRSLKVRANMANEMIGRSKPQDSRIDFESNGRKLDLRLSSFPTLYGDVLAIRLLDQAAPLLTLEQLGMAPEMLAQYERLVRRPNGMLLVTGPTNSGKTTTLYAALNRLSSPQIKIVTLEDPIECQLDGVDQSQMNPALGLTFASGLRAVLRQDANVIMVGEIRDGETADIAIRAALTGHVVLSSMHTRHSVGAITRLVDMGIEPHLIIASVNGIVAQRLVRVVCDSCKVPDRMAAAGFARLFEGETKGAPAPELAAGLARGTGCAACNATGYRGRIGIFEMLVLTDELRQLILQRSSTQIYPTVVASGKLRSMRADGLMKAAKGITTIEEVLRVTGERDDG